MITEIDCKRDRTSGPGGMRGRQELANWVRDWDWDWWTTLTFNRCVSVGESSRVLERFLECLERTVQDTVSCMIGQEQVLSASNKTKTWVHFHLLIGSAVSFPGSLIVKLWNKPEFGGVIKGGKSAEVEVYASHRGAAAYLMKSQTDPAWDVTFRNLDLLSPIVPKSAEDSSRQRRRLRRRDERALEPYMGSRVYSPSTTIGVPVSSTRYPYAYGKDPRPLGCRG